MEKRNIPIDKELHKEFKIFCAENNLIMSRLVEKLIESYIKEKGAQPNTLT